MPIAKIDINKCQGCGKCVDTCPEDVFRLNVNPDDKELLSPCATGCPAGISVRKYSYYIEMDMMDEAAEALAEMNPFPAITGRVCPHFCEGQCARQFVDEAVNINSLERYVGDYILKNRLAPGRKVYAGRVAVVGGGPSGVSCAYFLCRKGYNVTVFEKLPVVGGVMRVGIPAYRLPRPMVDDQIRLIAEMGVEFKTGITVGKDISLSELQAQYNAVFFANGLQLSRKVNTEGSDLDGILYGMEFLRSVGLGERPEIKEKVAVVGGGNVAVDVALTAIRMGAKEIRLFSLEDEAHMPAWPEEIEQAREEGILIHAGTAVKRILGRDGTVSRVEIMKCLRTIDEKGAFNPLYDDSECCFYDVDQVIFAIGQASEKDLLPKELNQTRGGLIIADPVTLETNLPGVFAGGDIAGLPNQNGAVVRAMASGKRGAESIDRYLQGKDQREGRDDTLRVQNPPKEGILPFPRQNTELIPVEARRNNFDQVKTCFTENQARMEAHRCMTCGSRSQITYPEDCMVCFYCERDCPAGAITVTPDRMARRMGPWDLDGK